MQGPHVLFACRCSFGPDLQVKHWLSAGPLQVRQVEAHCLQVVGVVELSRNQPSVVLHTAQVLFEYRYVVGLASLAQVLQEFEYLSLHVPQEK